MRPALPLPSAAADDGARAHARILFSDPSYLCMWTAGGLTGIIRWLQLLVLGIYTFEITGSPLLVSLVPMLWMLPLALCGPFVGVLADRVNRKTLFAVSLILIMSISAAMALLAHLGNLGFAHVALTSVLSGLFWTTDMPVRRRWMGDLSGEYLSTAMSLDSATSNATRMAGPLLGGVMLHLFSVSGVFTLSAIVFAVCLTLTLAAQVPAAAKQSPSAPSPSAFLVDLMTGARFVLRDANLRRVLAITVIFNIWGFPFTSMIPIIGRGQLSLGPVMVGVLSSTEGLGAFVGAIAVALLARPENFFRIYFWGTTAYLALVGYLGLLAHVAGGPYHSFVAATVTLTALGLASACFAAMQSTLTYLGAPPALRSRVLGVLTPCIGSGPIGFFNVGWMAELFGVPTALLIISAEGLFALLLLWVFTPDAPPAGALSPAPGD